MAAVCPAYFVFGFSGRYFVFDFSGSLLKPHIVWYNNPVMIKKQVINTICEHNLIQKHTHIVLGLSGGPDSVCLFHVLLSLAEEMDLTLWPVHINHKFRPGAAERDQAYAEALCEAYGISCRSFVFDCPSIAAEEGLTAEEAGRKVRYRAFAQVARELKEKGAAGGSICIAVAQNADDQAETILFRLLRGTGTDGLGGIKYQRQDEYGNRIVRPLLDIKKEEILKYCDENGLKPCIDHTNGETAYTRNRIRLELIPYLEREYNPSIKDTLIRMAKAAESDSDCLWKEAQRRYDKLVLKQAEGEILLNGPELRNCHKAVAGRVIAKAFARLGLTEDLTAAHFESCRGILFHSSPSAACDLPKGFYFAKVYENVKAGRRVQKDFPAPEQNRNLRISVMSTEEYGAEENRPLREDGRSCGRRNASAVFDYDKMLRAFGGGFEKRIAADSRAPGDYIALGSGSTKKIQNYFVDCKVPREERDRIPLVKIGSEVLWIVRPEDRSRFSADYNVCETTKTVICIEIICEI